MHTDEQLFAACGVRIGFAGRAGGVSTGPYESLNCGDNAGDSPALVKRNRALVCEAVGANADSLVVPSQVHGARVARVWSIAALKEVRGQVEEGVDAVVVEVPEVPLILNHADCLLLIVVSPSGRFAIVHAGWRGAVAGIAGAAVRELAACDCCSPADYNAYLGPHICAECFEVSVEVSNRFRAAFGDGVVPDARHVSLADAVKVDLERAGLERRRIAEVGLCTRCNPDRYFSYRATDGACGRNAAVAVWSDTAR